MLSRVARGGIARDAREHCARGRSPESGRGASARKVGRAGRDGASGGGPGARRDEARREARGKWGGNKWALDA